MIKTTSRSQWDLTILSLIRERAQHRQTQILFFWQASHWSQPWSPGSPADMSSSCLCTLPQVGVNKKVIWKQEWKAVLCKWWAERKQTQASKAGWKGSGEKTHHKFMEKYTNFQWVNILLKDGWHLLVPHIISSLSSDPKAGFTYFIRERIKGK